MNDLYALVYVIYDKLCNLILNMKNKNTINVKSNIQLNNRITVKVGLGLKQTNSQFSTMCLLLQE